MNPLDFMVEAIPNPVHPGPMEGRPAGANPAWAIVWPLLVSISGGVLCYLAAGMTLGLFLGGLIVVALITAPIVAAEKTWLARALAWAGAVHGVAGVWFYAAAKAELDLGLWASCYLVLATMAIAIGGLVLLLRGLRIGRIVAGFVVTLLALAWLSWPVWLSPKLGGKRGEQIAAWLVPVSPLFAVNSVLREGMGVWAEQPIAYNISIMSEVAYAMPDGVGWSLIVHLGVGVVGAGIGSAAARRTSTRSSSSPSAAA